MKKIISTTTILALLLSCNKTEKSADNQLTNNQKKETEQEFTLIKKNEEQISALLTPKQNDTIYVTNFFATWCKPCVNEIPHFKEKIEELKGEKIKFTFISLDNSKNSAEVNTLVKQFELQNNTILFDDISQINPDFFTKNFNIWKGDAIPFTLITKGDKKEEIIGSLDQQSLSDKINIFK